MPGIAGLISLRPGDECRRLVDQMLTCMQHESFYTSGSCADPELGVFASWVAHKGSFTDCQPLISERGDIAMLLAGECFSDPTSRARLKERGHRFESDDATWLVHLYEERGDHFFEELNGLFSGLVIDRGQRKAVLFNDRYGMERVYYHEGRDGFFFASEAKALLRIHPETRAFDDAGLAAFLGYGCTLGWKSLFRDIKLLPGASRWTFTGDQCEKRCYFVPANWQAQAMLPTRSFSDQLEETFARIIPRYFDGDGAIGISLTGGLDTRMIMACRPRNQHGLMSYTFAGNSSDTLDARLAARVAAACQVPHHTLRIGHDFFSNFASLVDRTVYITDGCFGACGAHEIYLHNQARGLAPVRLTGNFGSEILRGMTTFKPVGLSDDLLDHDFSRRIPKTEAPTAYGLANGAAFAAFREIPWHLFSAFRAAQSQVTWRTPYLDNEIVALAFRAPEGSRTSPSPALQLLRRQDSELARIPTDAGLVAESSLRSVMNYFWCRASFKLDYWCGEGMPHWLSSIEAHLSRLGLRLWPTGIHKYLHYGRWFRRELAPYLRERLTDVAIRQNPLWDRRFLDRLATQHISGRRNYTNEINAVLTLDAIERLLIKECIGQSL